MASPLVSLMNSKESLLRSGQLAWYPLIEATLSLKEIAKTNQIHLKPHITKCWDLWKDVAKTWLADVSQEEFKNAFNNEWFLFWLSQGDPIVLSTLIELKRSDLLEIWMEMSIQDPSPKSCDNIEWFNAMMDDIVKEADGESVKNRDHTLNWVLHLMQNEGPCFQYPYGKNGEWRIWEDIANRWNNPISEKHLNEQWQQKKSLFSGWEHLEPEDALIWFKQPYCCIFAKSPDALIPIVNEIWWRFVRDGKDEEARKWLSLIENKRADDAYYIPTLWGEKHKTYLQKQVLEWLYELGPLVLNEAEQVKALKNKLTQTYRRGGTSMLMAEYLEHADDISFTKPLDELNVKWSQSLLYLNHWMYHDALNPTLPKNRGLKEVDLIEWINDFSANKKKWWDQAYQYNVSYQERIDWIAKVGFELKRQYCDYLKRQNIEKGNDPWIDYVEHHSDERISNRTRELIDVCNLVIDLEQQQKLDLGMCDWPRALVQKINTLTVDENKLLKIKATIERYDLLKCTQTEESEEKYSFNVVKRL